VKKDKGSYKINAEEGKKCNRKPNKRKKELLKEGVKKRKKYLGGKEDKGKNDQSRKTFKRKANLYQAGSCSSKEAQGNT